MAGVVNKCKGCGKDQYDEATAGMGERGDLCIPCWQATKAVMKNSPLTIDLRGHCDHKCTCAGHKETHPLLDDSPKYSHCTVPNDTIRIRTENINRAEMLKCEYRAILAQRSHADLLEYAVNRINSVELNEAVAIVADAKNRFPEIF